MVSIMAALPPTTKFIVFSQWNSLLQQAMKVLADPSLLPSRNDDGASGSSYSLSSSSASASDVLSACGSSDTGGATTTLPATKSVLLQLGVQGQRAVEEFQSNPDMRVLLVCTKTGHGASGLNLTNAHHAMLLEPSLDVGLEQQAIGRVHRLGQEHNVVVHRLFAQYTVEDSIQVLQERRRKMFESRADSHEDIATSSNTREMMEVFGVVHLLQ
jgi:hypothetical protein